MKVLINSYTCCPGMGSEQGMGWNWITHLARHCELYVITEGEYRPQIEAWMNDSVNSLLAENLHFYWNPVTSEVRKMCWNQGDWRFYKYYKEWQKKTADIARGICKTESIQILHQLNMIGFREPGYLWQVSKETGIPFVWGPIGGLKQFPLAYTVGGGLKMKLFNSIKNFINILQIKYDCRVDEAMKQASLLISSIPDSYKAIKKYKGLESVVIPETGCFLDNSPNSSRSSSPSSPLTVLWVGKFDFRKRLDIAIEAVAKANRNIILKIYGTGDETQTEKAKLLVNKLGVSDMIQFMGNRPNNEVKDAMRKADLFLFTSVSEDTSTVVLEAVSNLLPVLCFDACGMSAVIDDTVGHKVPLTDPKQSINDFATQLQYFYDNPSELQKRSQGCVARSSNLSWEKKVTDLMEVYASLTPNPSLIDS